MIPSWIIVITLIVLCISTVAGFSGLYLFLASRLHTGIASVISFCGMAIFLMAIIIPAIAMSGPVLENSVFDQIAKEVFWAGL